MKHEGITEEIIGGFYEVYRNLGYGFLEKVYENALKIEFDRLGLKYTNQCPIKVAYKGNIIGDYVADFIIEDKIIVEIKATKGLSSVDEVQLVNYLAATSIDVGLLFNFGISPEIKRKIFEEARKDRNS